IARGDGGTRPGRSPERLAGHENRLRPTLEPTREATTPRSCQGPRTDPGDVRVNGRDGNSLQDGLRRIQGTLPSPHSGLEVRPEPRRHRHSLHPTLHRRLQRKNNTPRTTHSPGFRYTPMARIEPSTPALNPCPRNSHSLESSPAQDGSKY